jgi:hypothetical protein
MEELRGFMTPGRRALLGKGFFDLFKLLCVTGFASGFFVGSSFPSRIGGVVLLLALLGFSVIICPKGKSND